MDRRWFWLGVLLGVLTFFPMPRDSLWFDEIFTANLTTFPEKSPQQALGEILVGDVHPPLAYLPYWLWARLTGLDSSQEPVPPERLRALSGVWGALGVGVISAVHPVAGLVLAGSVPYALKSREARHYAWLGLLWVAGLYCLWRGWWGGWMALSVLALWSHNLSVFVVAAGGVALLLAYGWREALLRGGQVLTLWAPWAPFVWVGSLRAKEMLGLGTLEAGSQAILGTPLKAFPPEGWGALLGVVGVVGVVGVWRQDRRQGIVLLVPYLALLLWWAGAHLTGSGLYSDRYLGAFAPLLVFPLAVALRGMRLEVVTTLGVAALLSWLALLENPPSPGGEPHQEAARILQRLEIGTVVSNEQGRAISLRYYYRGASQVLYEPGAQALVCRVATTPGPVYLYLWENPLIGGQEVYQRLVQHFRLRRVLESSTRISLYRVEGKRGLNPSGCSGRHQRL